MKKILCVLKNVWGRIKSLFKNESVQPDEKEIKDEVINEIDDTMKLKVERIFKGGDYTIGKLYIDGVYFCDTLEDTDRGLTSSMSPSEIAKIKVKSETAIPTGTYEVVMNVVSPKYSADKYKKQYSFCDAKLPRLLDVPGYEGILIHIGNYPKDTDGCILVGKNTVKGAVMDSTNTFTALYAKLKESVGKITIEIV